MDKQRLLELAGVKRIDEGKYSPDSVKFLQCNDVESLEEVFSNSPPGYDGLFFNNGVLVKNEDAANMQELINEVHQK